MIALYCGNANANTCETARANRARVRIDIRQGNLCGLQKFLHSYAKIFAVTSAKFFFCAVDNVVIINQSHYQVFCGCVN